MERFKATLDLSWWFQDKKGFVWTLGGYWFRLPTAILIL